MDVARVDVQELLSGLGCVRLVVSLLGVILAWRITHAYFSLPCAMSPDLEWRV